MPNRRYRLSPPRTSVRRDRVDAHIYVPAHQIAPAKPCMKPFVGDEAHRTDTLSGLSGLVRLEKHGDPVLSVEGSLEESDGRGAVDFRHGDSRPGLGEDHLAPERG